MFERSTLEICPDRLKVNLDFIRSLLPSTTEFCSVVKANAYGHGLDIYPPLAEQCGVVTFAVSSAEESFLLHPHISRQTTRIVMSQPPTDALEWLIENEIHFYISDANFISEVARVASLLEKAALVHLEVETGMFRTGIRREQLNFMLEQLAQHSDLVTPVAVCSHLAGAEQRGNSDRVTSQITEFHRIADQIAASRPVPLKRHLASSAATIAYPETALDLVRVGVMQYGFWPTQAIYEQYLSTHAVMSPPLKQILTWRTYVHSLTDIPEGRHVGYGKSYKALRNMQIAVLPIGYSDGYSRVLSNLGYVLIRGHRAPIVGMINMNLMSVDVTAIPGMEVGDEVVLMGTQGQEHIGVCSFSDDVRGLNYESLTRLSERIPRVVTPNSRRSDV